MLPTEMAFSTITLALLVAHNVRGVPRAFLTALFAAGLATFALSAWLDQARWQMAPAYLLFAILSLLLLKRSPAHIAVRGIGVVLGVAVLAIGAGVSLGLPILVLPAPAGPYAVGSTSLSLGDESRDNAFFGVPAERRDLYVQLWYPGVVDGQPEVRTLWEELHRGELDRFTLFTRYLRGVSTHSHRDVPLSPAGQRYPVILFSHAIVSFAEQNTLLMEHLASHGFVVASVSHPYASMRAIVAGERAIYPALDKIREASAEFAAANEELAARVAQASGRDERAELELASYERAHQLNELTAIWVSDLRFVLDSLLVAPERHTRLQMFSGRLDAERVGALGMSFGGAAITDFCKEDERCRAAMNIDGGAFGRHQRRPLEAPYLVLLREDRDDADYLRQMSRSDYHEIKVAGAAHLDFTDDAVVLPILEWLNVSGPISGERIVEIVNAVSLRFFDAYLRDGPEPRFDGEFREITVVARVRAPNSR